MQEPEWGRIDDALEIAPVSRSQFYHWMTAGLIRTARIGNARFVDMNSVRQLFENAVGKKIPKQVSRTMRERAYASHIVQAERKAREKKK
jgi:hypothetical protein